MLVYIGCMTNQEQLGMQDRGTPQARIVAAAGQILAERGYDATTIKEIAKGAGVAPGLVHYYFANKDEVLVAVLHAASDQMTVYMQRLRDDVSKDEFRRVALPTVRSWVEQQPAQYRLRYELYALALRNPKLLPGIQALFRSARAAITQSVRLLTQGTEVDETALAAVLFATFDGLALQQLTDPDFDLAAAYEALEQILSPLLQAE